MKTSTKAILATAGVSGAIAGTAVIGSIAAILAARAAARVLFSQPVPEGAVVVITGGSRGLGYALASRFARKPVRLVLAARDRDELESAQASLMDEHPHLAAHDFYLFTGDLMDPTECHRLVSDTLAHFGRIDVLVNNAGIIEVGPVENQALEVFERAFRIYYLAPLTITMAALPHMLRQTPAPGWKRRAAIVNISSIGGKVAVPHLLPYCAGKFALVGFSEGLHAELRHKGIRITTVCPGLMRTGGEEHANFSGQAEKEKKWFKLSAKTPGLSTSVKYAANRIYSAVVTGRAELTITPQAWAAARFHGLCPETSQYAASLVNHYMLPKPTNRQDDSIAGESQED
ncbi:MAG TPA: SDR family NAD(P)-dependent oxidoreductase [Acidobacteriaceae bacterium]|jgi:short-subunit dehydrogenase|nr:SDR family NAD(P)-dependent oxidoreductase [Acidobacteriaceae bacterium]